MAVSQRMRFEVLRRDGFKCRYCGTGADAAELEVDHVTPIALGGTDRLDNLVTSCGPCNDGKASIVPDEAVKAALVTTAPAPVLQASEVTASQAALDALELRRLVWGLIVDYSPRELSEPLGDGDRSVAMNAAACWELAWAGPYPRDPGAEPTRDQFDAFTASVTKAITLRPPLAVLLGAGTAAGWARSLDVAPHLHAVQLGVATESARLS